jgi:hypothetical protein
MHAAEFNDFFFRRELFWQKRRANGRDGRDEFFSHGCSHNLIFAVLLIMDEFLAIGNCTAIQMEVQGKT